MKILLVSGFLGAGKTTFIQELVRRTGREFVILENEYAPVNIDGRLLAGSLPSDTKVNIWEMTEGCICCSMKGDFAASVLTIANTLDPDYLIVEPTGVGMLSNVISNLTQIEYERITLLAPVTVLDCKNYLQDEAEYPSIMEDQIKYAKTVVISKNEHLEADEFARAREFIKRINSEADIPEGHYSSCPQNWWKDLLSYDWKGNLVRAAEVPDVQDLPDTFSLKNVSMTSPGEFICFLEDLIRGEFGSVIRAKGYVKISDEMAAFDVTEGEYSIKGTEMHSESSLIFIGRPIFRDKISSRFSHEGITKPQKISYEQVKRSVNR